MQREVEEQIGAERDRERQRETENGREAEIG
jgi:hypothetical protein